MKDNSGAESKFLEAMAWFEKGDFTEAQKILLELVQEYPTFPNSYRYLGWLYFSKFDAHQKAEDYYKKGIEIDPAYLPTYYWYANFLLDQHRTEELSTFLSQLKEIKGVSFYEVTIDYAILYELLGEYHEAIRYYKKSRQYCINPDALTKVNEAIARCRSKMKYYFLSPKNLWNGLKENWLIVWLVIILLIFIGNVGNRG